MMVKYIDGTPETLNDKKDENDKKEENNKK